MWKTQYKHIGNWPTIDDELHHRGWQITSVQHEITSVSREWECDRMGVVLHNYGNRTPFIETKLATYVCMSIN